MARTTLKTRASSRPPKTGTELAWKWVLTLVALTFLAIYLLNNIKPGIIQPITIEGWSANPSLPSDA